MAPAKSVVVYSGRPRGGRRFQPTHELALSGDALVAATTLPDAHLGVRVLIETSGPFGVPDLLALVGDPSSLERRLGSQVPPLLNRIDAGIVSACSSKTPRAAEAIAKSLGWSLSTIKRRVPGLVRSGALHVVPSGALIRAEELTAAGRLYAIEAKVKDWRRALTQGRRYSVWCDSYIIVMPELPAGSSAQLVTEVKSDRAGLVLGGKWVTRPRLGKRTQAQRLWGSEHVVAAVRGG